MAAGGRLKSAFCDQYLTLSEKWCKTGTQLLWKATRKSYALYQMLVFPMTLSNFYLPGTPHFLLFTSSFYRLSSNCTTSCSSCASCRGYCCGSNTKGISLLWYSRLLHTQYWDNTAEYYSLPRYYCEMSPLSLRDTNISVQFQLTMAMSDCILPHTRNVD